MDQIAHYSHKDLKESVVQKQEYGTLVEKDKKKKKKKNKKDQPDKHKEIDEEKIRQIAKTSELHNVAELTQEEISRYSFAENHPLKIICSNLPFKITIEELFQYFNTVIAASNP